MPAFGRVAACLAAALAASTHALVATAARAGPRQPVVRRVSRPDDPVATGITAAIGGLATGIWDADGTSAHIESFDDLRSLPLDDLDSPGNLPPADLTAEDEQDEERQGMWAESREADVNVGDIPRCPKCAPIPGSPSSTVGQCRIKGMVMTCDLTTVSSAAALHRGQHLPATPTDGSDAAGAVFPRPRLSPDASFEAAASGDPEQEMLSDDGSIESHSGRE